MADNTDYPDQHLFLHQLKYLAIIMLIITVLSIPIGNNKKVDPKVYVEQCDSCTLCKVYCTTTRGVQTVGDWVSELSLDPIRRAFRQGKAMFYRMLQQIDGDEMCTACSDSSSDRGFKASISSLFKRKCHCASCRAQKPCKRTSSSETLD